MLFQQVLGQGLDIDGRTIYLTGILQIQFTRPLFWHCCWAVKFKLYLSLVFLVILVRRPNDEWSEARVMRFHESADSS